MKKLLLLFSILFTTQVAGEQTASGGSEIFSKQDAAAMFEFSLKEWKNLEGKIHQVLGAELHGEGLLI